jgi:hypothetical protein
VVLREILYELTASDRSQAEENLQLLADDSALGYQAVQNFYGETRLSAEAWRHFLDGLRGPAVDVLQIKDAITNVSRRWQMRGPELVGIRHLVFVRVISIGWLCDLLFSLDHYGSLKSARRAIRNILEKPIDVVADRWRDVELGRYFMWATFDISGRRLFLDGESGDYIQGVLGLDRSCRETAFILLEYTLPLSVNPRIPTVADAYSGSPWPYFFRPAPEGLSHGLTMPWPEYSAEPPRPEVVHAVIQGRQLFGMREVLS